MGKTCLQVKCQITATVSKISLEHLWSLITLLVAEFQDLKIAEFT